MGFKRFSYTKDKEDKAKIYWQSDNRKCKERVVMQSSEVVKETPHNIHRSDSASGTTKQSLARLTFSQTTNFRLFQTERVCRLQFQI